MNSEPSRTPGPHLPPDQLMDFYRLAQDVRKYHHSALWEIEKHFTWWVSILLGALFLLLANARNLDSTLSGWAFGLIAFVGLAISLIGFLVVRREGRYFTQALQICNRAAKALGLDVNVYVGQQRAKPGAPLETVEFTLHPDDYRVRSFDVVDKEANKRYELLNVFSLKLNIRDYFQIVLATSVIVFTVLVVSAILGGGFNRGLLAGTLSGPPLAASIPPLRQLPDNDRFVQIALVSQRLGPLTLYALDGSGQVWSLSPANQTWSKLPSRPQLASPATGPAPLR